MQVLNVVRAKQSRDRVEQGTLNTGEVGLLRQADEVIEIDIGGLEWWATKAVGESGRSGVGCGQFRGVGARALLGVDQGFHWVVGWCEGRVTKACVADIRPGFGERTEIWWGLVPSHGQSERKGNEGVPSGIRGWEDDGKVFWRGGGEWHAVITIGEVDFHHVRRSVGRVGIGKML